MNTSAAQTTPPLPEAFVGTLRRTQRLGLVAGLAGLALAVVGWLAAPDAFYRGYLVAWLFWGGLSLGCLALLMLHHLVAGGWGFVTQRSLEAGAQCIAVMAVCFLPLLFGLHHLYEWTHDEVVAGSVVLQHKRPYLNVPFYLVRTVIYFSAWIGLAFLLGTWSLRQYRTRRAIYSVQMRRLSAAGLILHILLMTFASLDWVMSLDPHWFSTIFAWLMTVSQTLTALAFTILLLARYRARPPLAEAASVKHVHDYGNLMLAFVILWSYMMFAQYLIMWSGNIPEDIEWYVQRKEGAWFWVAPFLVVFHFVMPFLLLLFRRVKRSTRGIQRLAAALLAVHVVFLAWLVLPTFDDLSVLAFGIGLAAFLGLGGLWLAAYAWLLAGRPLLPRHDPRFEELLHPHART